jgi:hypothetical protein
MPSLPEQLDLSGAGESLDASVVDRVAIWIVAVGLKPGCYGNWSESLALLY